MKTTTFLFITAGLLTASCGEEDAAGDPRHNPPQSQAPSPSTNHPAPANTPPTPPANPPPANGNTVPSAPAASRRTDVPDELVGVWQHGWIDFDLWENYKQGTYAGRNATPSREAMIFEKNGNARFYRYEFAFTLYEELIDCEGTVAFNGNGTFTFHPTKGRKRFHDLQNSFRSVDRALSPAELLDPKLAGTRAYRYDGSSDPPTIQIRVPTSAPYNWYKTK